MCSLVRYVCQMMILHTILCSIYFLSQIGYSHDLFTFLCTTISGSRVFNAPTHHRHTSTFCIMCHFPYFSFQKSQKSFILTDQVQIYNVQNRYVPSRFVKYGILQNIRIDKGRNRSRYNHSQIGKMEKCLKGAVFLLQLHQKL